MIVRQAFPGGSVGAVVLADRAPSALAQVGAPALPMFLARPRLRQAYLFLRHLQLSVIQKSRTWLQTGPTAFPVCHRWMRNLREETNLRRPKGRGKPRKGTAQFDRRSSGTLVTCVIGTPLYRSRRLPPRSGRDAGVLRLCLRQAFRQCTPALARANAALKMAG